MKTRQIKDIISKPSEALQAMVDGLKAQSEREDFVIDMDSYGTHDYKICYGCAATCTIQQLTGKKLTSKNIDETSDRAKFLKLDEYDLDDFEFIMNNVRSGYYIEGLLQYFNITKRVKRPCFSLKSHNWKEEIPKVKKYIKYLQEKGL